MHTCFCFFIKGVPLCLSGTVQRNFSRTRGKGLVMGNLTMQGHMLFIKILFHGYIWCLAELTVTIKSVVFPTLFRVNACMGFQLYEQGLSPLCSSIHVAHKISTWFCFAFFFVIYTIPIRIFLDLPIGNVDSLALGKTHDDTGKIHR